MSCFRLLNRNLRSKTGLLLPWPGGGARIPTAPLRDVVESVSITCSLVIACSRRLQSVGGDYLTLAPENSASHKSIVRIKPA
jgi:hypothetical protein